MTLSQRRSIRQGAIIVFLGVFVSVMFIVQINEVYVRHAVVNAILIGLILSLILAVCELWLFRRQGRRLQFIVLFAMRVVVYLLSVVLVSFNVFVISRMRRFDMSYRDVVVSDEFQTYLADQYFVIVFYALLIMATVNFASQMNRKLGPGMLWAYISGKYRQPVKRSHIIMFVDLIGSKMIVKHLGAAGYHAFFNDIIYDITESIVSNGGSIIHYVDDEIVVNWPTKKGLEDARCIRSYFDMKRTLHSLSEKYYDKYGFLPGIRGAAHYGDVIIAEVGAVKSELCFVGDVMNTTSRILDQCIASDEDILISEDLKSELVLPIMYRAEEQGKHSMKGKDEPMRLYSIKIRRYATAR